MDNQANKKAAYGFAEALAKSLAEPLTQAVGSPCRVKVLETPDLSTRQERPIHYRITAEGALRGQCFVELYEAQVAELGAKILAQKPAAFSTAHRDAVGKAVSSAMTGLATALSAEYGEVSFKIDQVEDLAFGGMLVVPLDIVVGDEAEIPVHLYFETQFLSALSSSGPMKRSAETLKADVDPVNLKLVMDVELNVSLRFGQRQLPLRDVLELTSGSVIELDRQVDEPVELLLDGKVIALGEAVIVDGNYGLRVTEVPQPIAAHLGC